jgi:prepilin-type N-terminal cleavage/methylation domain-containing protein
MLGRYKQRGDTLIEVLFAISVFSMVVVGALAIMNQGTAASQRSLEITLVRQQIDAQAETLRFMHDSYVAVYQSGLTFNTSDSTTSPAEEWSRILGSVRTSASAVNDCPVTVPTGSFVVDPVNVRFNSVNGTTLPGDTFAQIEYLPNGTTYSGTNGLWIEAVRSANNTGDGGNQVNTGYIDFHILACWDSAGVPLPSTQGTIVRLYEPRG